jgi:hypothetical protein
MDEKAEHLEARVAITPFCARRKFERTCGVDPHQLVLGIVTAEIDNAFAVQRLLGVSPDVRKPSGVRQQVPDGHGVPVLGGFREVLRDRVIEGDLAILDEKHQCGSRKLLGDRADLKDRLRRDWDIQFEVRHAVTRGLDDVAFSDDGNAEARNSFLLHRSADDVIHRRRELVIARSRIRTAA